MGRKEKQMAKRMFTLITWLIVGSVLSASASLADTSRPVSHKCLAAGGLRAVYERARPLISVMHEVEKFGTAQCDNLEGDDVAADNCIAIVFKKSDQAEAAKILFGEAFRLEGCQVIVLGGDVSASGNSVIVHN
jgi:hypothetical protein